MNARIGSQVVATEKITEAGFMNHRLHVHANRGDVGRVVDLCGDGVLTVRFAPSGTVTDVVPGENCELLDARA